MDALKRFGQIQKSTQRTTCSADILSIASMTPTAGVESEVNFLPPSIVKGENVSNLIEPRFVDKFIAFFDVLGWKSLVGAAEKKNGSSLQEVLDVLDMIRSELKRCRDFFENDGPKICPAAIFDRKDMDFRFTFVSDSVLLSVEVSPAGLINLLNCCGIVYSKLFLRKGLMCRGYIKRGSIYHTADYCVGSGFSDVVEGEKKVSIFKTESGERGTPFIEVNRNIIQYVNDEISDNCVKKMFSEFVKVEDDVAAIFPFKRLDPGLFGDGTFAPDKERKTIATVRNWIGNAKEMVRRHVDPSSESARRKERCLIRFLDAQLDVCDTEEKMIEEAMELFPADCFEEIGRNFL